MLNMEEMVVIECYHSQERMKRKDAIRKYKQAMECSEGSERDRYVNIFLQLLDGETECSDEYY